MFERIYQGLHIHDLLTSPLALVDVLLLAIVIYQLLLLVRGTRSVNMMLALAVLVLFHLVTRPGLLSLNAFHTVLGMLLGYVPIAVIVLFQNQIRRFLANLGKNPLAPFMAGKEQSQLAEEISLAAASLASKRLGALIVIERDMGLRTFYETGIALDARVSYDLLMNIFTFHSPLHDGAAIIAEGRIKAASCYLPLTMNPTLSRMYGTRHRAAFGITEESDALAVVVSEERGVISLVDGAEIVEHLDAKGLQKALIEALGGEREVQPVLRARPAAIYPESTDA
jgi:diadenylate cyclase